MYTVLLADDENMVLETLQNNIAWSQFGVDQLLLVNDGVQALEMIESRQIDLLITDIRMPRMDGLELIRRIAKTHPSTHSILLTAYGEFEYAREAIQLGVENYLLKPIKTSELEETIEKALDNIYAKRQTDHQKETETLFANNILLRWLRNTISEEELSERAAFLDINLYLPNYCVVCIQKKRRDVTVRPYCEAVREALSKRYETYLMWDQRDYNLFIIGGAKLDADELLSVFREKAAAYEQGRELALAIGEIVKRCGDVPISYQAACRRLDAADLNREGLIVLGGSAMDTIRTDEVFLKLDSLFRIKDNDERERETREYLLSLAGGTSLFAKVYAQLSNAVVQLFVQRFPHRRDVRQQAAYRMHMPAALDSREAFVQSALEALDYNYLIYQHTINELSPAVARAIRYIQERSAQALSIKEYCATAKISTPYFGHLFKTETGVFFNNYLNQYRLSSAIALLRDTNLKIGDVAEKVGFSSTSYFIACFRKQTGLSPIKYREMQGFTKEGWLDDERA